MAQDNFTDYGVLTFMPFESYVDPYRGLSVHDRIDRLLEEAFDEKFATPETVGDWPRIQVAIRRDGLFVIEAETPTFKAMLRFDPQHPDAGDFEIHHRPHGGVESGRTTHVIAVPGDEKQTRLSVLAPFATRYAVVTVGRARPYARMVWRVGLREYRTVLEPAGSA